MPQAFDVTDAPAVVDAVAKIEAEIGAIDILVNNAGMQKRAALQDFEMADWQQLMRTNLDSVFIVGQAVARHMIARGRGKIINICSVQSELGRPGIAPYTASKGALKMLTKGMAIDWGPHGLQVNGLGPGYFKTELNQALVDNPEFSAWLIGRTPSRRWGDVEDLVGAAVFLASDASRFVNGHILYVDGGVTAQLSFRRSRTFAAEERRAQSRRGGIEAAMLLCEPGAHSVSVLSAFKGITYASASHTRRRRPARRRSRHAATRATPTAGARARRRHLRFGPALLPARRLRHGAHQGADGAGPRGRRQRSRRWAAP